MENYAKNILLGMAVGDALGVPVEFMSRESLQQNPVIDMMGNGVHMQPKGTWSDDSSLAFCLAESLCEKGLDIEDMGQKIVAWYTENYWTPHGEVFDIGVRTKQAIDRMMMLMKEDKPIEPIPKNETRRSDNGNGSLMRILPLSLCLHKKPLLMRYQIVDEVSSLTHAHPVTIMACFAYTELALQIIEGIDKMTAYYNVQKICIEQFGKNPEYRYIKRFCETDISTLPIEEIKSTGYVIDSLEASLWCFLKHNNYANTVLEAVNLGSDTDATACIAGGLAGLLYGHAAIPEAWVKSLARVQDILNLAERLQQYYLRRMAK